MEVSFFSLLVIVYINVHRYLKNGQQLAQHGANVHKLKSQVVADVLAQPLQVLSLEVSFPAESKTVKTFMTTPKLKVGEFRTFS